MSARPVILSYFYEHPASGKLLDTYCAWEADSMFVPPIGTPVRIKAAFTAQLGWFQENSLGGFVDRVEVEETTYKTVITVTLIQGVMRPAEQKAANIEFTAWYAAMKQQHPKWPAGGE